MQRPCRDISKYIRSERFLDEVIAADPCAVLQDSSGSVRQLDAAPDIKRPVQTDLQPAQYILDDILPGEANDRSRDCSTSQNGGLQITITRMIAITMATNSPELDEADVFVIVSVIVSVTIPISVNAATYTAP